MKPSRAPGRFAYRATPHDPGTAAPHGTRIGGLTARVLAWWVDQARRLAWLIVGVATLGAVSGGYYAATHLGMNTDTEAMLSSELPFRKLSMDFDKAFPQLGDNIVIVIDGRSPDQAEDAAIALAAKLRFRTDLFRAVYFPQGDAFFRRNGLLFLSVEELHSLADRLADAEPLLSRLANDMSLRGMFDLLGQAAEEVAKGDARPEPLVPALRMIGDTVEAYLEGRPAKLSWRELMAPEPLQPSDYRQFIAVQPSPDYATLAPAEAAIKTIRQAAAEFSLDEAHGVRVRLTGGVPMREDELASVRESVSLAGVIALTLVSIVVFIGLRSPRLVAGTMATLLIGLVWTAAFAALAIRQLNLVSVTFAVLFIGLAVDFSIQFGLRYKESIDAGEQHAAALRRAATGTGVGVSLAALCAAIGFFSFVPTAYVGLSELGIIAGVGMFIGAFGALTLLPAILTLMPPRPAAHRAPRMGAAAVRALVQRHARTICVAALVIGLASLAALPEARFDFDPVNLRDPNTESVQTYLDLARDSGTSPYRINVLAPDVDATVNLGDRLERLAVVDKTVTVRSFVPKDQGDKLAVIDDMALFLTPILEFSELREPPTVAERRAATADFREKLNALTTSSNAGPLARPAERLTNLLARFARGPGRAQGAYSDLENALLSSFPGRLDALREAMKAGSVSQEDLPDDVRTRYVTADGRARVEVFPAERLTDHEALRHFVTSVRSVAPNATDAPVILLAGGDTVITAFKQAGLLALVMVSGLLIAVLRNSGDLILVLLPLALAALLTVAYTVMSGTPFNFANVIALPLLLSLGVAFGIYLVLRYRETGDVIEMLHTSTPRAVVFSALTTMVSFGSLMVSSHRGTASMGELLVVSLGLALTCMLVVLPALLTYRQSR